MPCGNDACDRSHKEEVAEMQELKALQIWFLWRKEMDGERINKGFLNTKRKGRNYDFVS